MSAGESAEAVELDLVGVVVDTPANVPVMHLREQDGERRVLSIYIGVAEASAIRIVLDGHKSPRPLTHDLMVEMLEEFGAHLNRVVITEMKNHTYFAELQLVHNGQRHTISCRPSDAVALAVRSEVPITASRDLLDQVGQVVEEGDDESEEEVLEEFRDFIDSINPEDFQEK
jgi:bifunctional DNase/RNase